MNDTNDELARRTFLKQSAVGAFGFAGWVAQDEPEQARYTRRMVFPFPERLGENLRQKIIIATDRKDQRPDELKGVDENEVDACNFSDWPPETMSIWEGIIVDWKNALGTVGFYASNPTVRATQLVERNTIFVDEQSDPVPLGTPFIVNGLVDCPGDLQGVTATKIPGINIKTGPGEGTGEGTADLSEKF